jgi:hypothetical protein
VETLLNQTYGKMLVNEAGKKEKGVLTVHVIKHLGEDVFDEGRRIDKTTRCCFGADAVGLYHCTT